MANVGKGKTPKVPPTNRAQMKPVVSSGQTAGTFVSTLPIGGGLPTKNVVPESSVENADFYRNGYQSADKTQFPKTIVPFWASKDAKPASFRIYGKKVVKNKDGGSAPREKADSDLIPPYTKMIISNVSEQSQERTQVIQTFGDAYIFFYGKQPSIFSFSGTLINTKNANWVADFYYIYENFLRGTKLTELDAKFVLTYGGRQIEGVMLNCNMDTNAQIEEGVSVSFQVFVTKRNLTGLSEDFGLLTDSDGKIIRDAALRDVYKTFAAGEGTSDPLYSYGFGETKKAMGGGAAKAISPPNPIANSLLPQIPGVTI
jgi:hypothetical protein